MRNTDLRELTTKAAIKVSHYITKLEKYRKVRKEFTEEDSKRYNELHGLIWALNDITGAVDSLTSAECSEELLSDIRHSAVLICEKIEDIIKK